MTDQPPAETLRAAAVRLRNATFPDDVSLTLAKLMDSAAEDFDMCERVNSRDPHNDGKTRVMPHHLAALSLAVARQLLGGTS